MQQEKIYDLEEKNFELESQLEAKNQETRDLANIASVITSILDIETVLAVAMEIGVRQVGGEVGAVLLLDDGDPVVKVAWGVDSDFIKALPYKEDLDLAHYCLKQQQTFCDNNLAESHPDLEQVRNLIAAPIPAKATSGTMIIFNKETGPGFSERDCEALEMICRFTSVAIENASLLAESLEKQKIEQELELARQVQATLLPEFPDLGGISIASTYLPARQVGGDYYDVIPVGRNKILFLLGDVTNKGVPAALVMTAVYSIIRAYVTSGRPIRVIDIITQLNNILCNDIIKGRDMFITLFLAYMDLESNQMEYCNGGHPPPFYYRSSANSVTRLKPGGPLVGQFASMPYRSTRIKIDRGDRIFIYSDGIIEAEDRAGHMYGMDRLEVFFKAGLLLNAHRFNNVMREEIERFSVGAREEAVDDFTTLVIDIIGRETETKIYRFTYRSDLSSLSQMYTDLEDIFTRHTVPAHSAYPFQVAVSEALTNAIIHAHKDDSSKKIHMSVELNELSLIADILDEGDTRDPEALRGRSRDLGDDHNAEGGRGLGIIERLSDEVDIACRPQGGIAFRIVKHLNEQNKST